MVTSVALLPTRSDLAELVSFHRLSMAASTVQFGLKRLGGPVRVVHPDRDSSILHGRNDCVSHVTGHGLLTTDDIGAFKLLAKNIKDPGVSAI